PCAIWLSERHTLKPEVVEGYGLSETVPGLDANRQGRLHVLERLLMIAEHAVGAADVVQEIAFADEPPGRTDQRQWFLIVFQRADRIADVVEADRDVVQRGRGAQWIVQRAPDLERSFGDCERLVQIAEPKDHLGQLE